MNHPEILIVDNYDSFVYNIAQYLGELGASVTVLRNDSDLIQDSIDGADGFILSPGPGHPRDSRKTLDISRMSLLLCLNGTIFKGMTFSR